jgi:hypothetical protein
LPAATAATAAVTLATAAVTAPAPPPPAPGPKKIKLTIETEPAGASLSKGGFEVCPATPCEIEVDPDEKLELVAKKGAAKGEKKLIATRDQTVAIPLVAPRAAPAQPAGPRMCEVMVDGLKILRPCP